jgi:hypothetical protein
MDEVPKLTPAMFGHAVRVYDKMAEEAIMEDVHDIEGQTLVWQGYTTKLVSELGIPVPYYGKILVSLQTLGCIHQLQRGGGNSPSRWAVFHPPEADKWIEVQEDLKARPRGNKQDALEQRLDAIEQRLQGIDVAQALADLQSQISALKGEVSA